MENAHELHDIESNETTSSLPTATLEVGSFVNKPYKSRKQKPSRPPLTVWDHFVEIEDRDPNDPRCKCKYCGKDYACNIKTVEQILYEII